jgi:hypothetical protein
MKKFGLAGLVAGALSAAVIGFAGPAQADDHDHGFRGHHGDHGFHYGYDRDDRDYPWFDQLYPSVRVPHVDTSVHN